MRAMFGIILISVCTVMQVYLFWRACSVPFVVQHVPRWALFGLGILLWGILVIGRFYGHHNRGTTAWLLELTGMTWIGVLFLTTLPLFAADLVTGFGLPGPRFATWGAMARGWALAAGMILSAIALFQGMRAPTVENYEVHLRGLPPALDGTVIVGLSDLHIGSLLGKNWLAGRVSQVQAEKPDLIVLLGDLFEGHGGPQTELLPILRGLDAPLGVWAVPGNHESYGRHGGLALLEEAGAQVLLNRCIQIRPGFILAGVEDLTTFHRAGLKGDPVGLALAGCPPGATVLLSHTPWETKRAANAGVGLMLSGHTHGGQIWPFGYLVRRVYPLLAGRYDEDGMAVIVCRGTGTWGPRMRLWHPGKILRVVLRREASVTG